MIDWFPIFFFFISLNKSPGFLNKTKQKNNCDSVLKMSFRFIKYKPFFNSISTGKMKQNKKQIAKSVKQQKRHFGGTHTSRLMVAIIHT